jgi:hypothetical protein
VSEILQGHCDIYKFEATHSKFSISNYKDLLINNI